MLQLTVPAGFIAPCLPIKTTKLPYVGQWLHEIKHDRIRSGAVFRLTIGTEDSLGQYGI
jgi:hypothetical protein